MSLPNSTESELSAAMKNPEISLPNDEFGEDRLPGKNRLMLTIREKACEFKASTDSYMTIYKRCQPSEWVSIVEFSMPMRNERFE